MVIPKLNKKGMEFQSAFFSIIIISMAIVAIGVMINEYNSAYGTGQTSDLGEYNKLDNLSSQATSQRSQLSASDPDPSDNAESNTYRGVYGILVSMYSSLGLVFGENGMINSISNRFNIPSYVTYGIVTMMIFAITFTLVAIIFRLSRRSA